MLGQVIDWVFEKMVMKIVDFDFEIEKVELIEEENIVMENKDMIVRIEDIEDIFHKEFSNFESKMEFEIVGAKVAITWL